MQAYFHIPNYRDLDGWDAVLVFVSLVATVATHVAFGFRHGALEAMALGGCLGPVVLRKTLWPRRSPGPREHTLLTLLLIAVGGFVALLGVLAEALLLVMFADPKAAPGVPPAIVLLPALVIALGAIAIYGGFRLARTSPSTTPVPAPQERDPSIPWREQPRSRERVVGGVLAFVGGGALAVVEQTWRTRYVVWGVVPVSYFLLVGGVVIILGEVLKGGSAAASR